MDIEKEYKDLGNRLHWKQCPRCGAEYVGKEMGLVCIICGKTGYRKKERRRSDRRHHERRDME